MDQDADALRMTAALRAVQSYFPHDAIALVVFVPNPTDEGAGSMVNYIGNVPREQMLTALKVVVGRWEGTKLAGSATRQ
jgi:hypothetical protein